jgi:hypothetical protein
VSATITSPDRQFIQKRNVFDADVKGELVMVCLDRDSYFGLNEIGARVWSILSKPHSLRELSEILTTEYEVDFATVMTEISVLLDDLATNGLILPVASD